MKVESRNKCDCRMRGEIVAGVEHLLSAEAGKWQVAIVGPRANDNREMKRERSRGFERSCTLAGGAGEHPPEEISDVLIMPLEASPR